MRWDRRLAPPAAGAATTHPQNGQWRDLMAELLLPALEKSEGVFLRNAPGPEVIHDRLLQLLAGQLVEVPRLALLAPVHEHAEQFLPISSVARTAALAW